MRLRAETTHKAVYLAKIAAVVGLVGAALLSCLHDPSGVLHLFLPVIASALTLRIGGKRLVWAGQAILWAGLAVLAVSTSLPPLTAVLVGLTSTLVVLVAWPDQKRSLGIYGLVQSTEDEILRTLLNSVPVVLLDDKGNIQRASAASREIFGLSVQELANKPLSDLIRGFEGIPFCRSDFKPGMIPPVGQNWHVQLPQGHEMAVELWLTHTQQGPLIRLVDLTPRQTADAQARELHSQLNKVWRLNSLGEMAATLAHELNQPLGAAASYLHAAQEDMKMAGALGESALRTTDLAKAQMLRGGQIIRRMRELLTMEMRALAKERLSSVVEDVLPILVLTGRDRNIAITTDIVMPDTVRMDRIQVQQALVNLVRNAVEASPNDSQVLVTGHPISDTIYEIAVEDSGPGIAADQVDRVFQPMTTTKSGGMGLGLSVTRTIVESHGGHLKVGSSRWGGARFSFTLSIATPEVPK